MPATTMRWPDILDSLSTLDDVDSIMVEGGAQVIESLLSAEGQPSSREISSLVPAVTDLVDALIITVSPKFAGPGATRYQCPAIGTTLTDAAAQSASSELRLVRRQWFGDDAVWMWKRRRPETSEAR